MSLRKDRMHLSDEALEMIAARFRCLGEPIRLKILRALEEGEANVGQLVRLLHASQANVSKHLKVLVESGILARRARGTSAFYSIADPVALELCRIVCEDLARKLKAQAVVFGLTVAEEEAVRRS